MKLHLSLQSFHFSPRLPGKDWASSEAAHEARLAALLKLGPGKKCLDVGCGVGGPMRTIASTSGAEVTGITINDYQVSRAKHHNEKVSSSFPVRRCSCKASANFSSPSGIMPCSCVLSLYPCLGVQLSMQALCNPVQGNFPNILF